MMIHQIARAIANFNIALEFSEESIHEDDVVKILEQLGGDLQELDAESRKILSDSFRHIAPEYEGELRHFVETLPDTIGLEDEDM
jgi:hypothetical protein